MKSIIWFKPPTNRILVIAMRIMYTLSGLKINNLWFRMKPLYFFFICVSLLFNSFNGFATSNKKVNILYINSYHIGNKWSDGVMEGFRSYFKSDDSIYIYTEFLDSKRVVFNDLKSAAASYFDYKYREIPIDLLVTADNVALDFILDYKKNSFFKDVPIVFCGISNPLEYHIIKDDLYGVVEVDPFDHSFSKFLEIFPQTEQIYFISDRSQLGKLYTKIASAFTSPNSHLKLNVIDSVYQESLADQIKSLNQNNAILYYAVINIDGSGKPTNDDEMSELVAKNSPIPAFSGNITDIQGYTGGYYTRGETHGVETAQLVKEILMGNKPKERLVFSKLDGLFDYNMLTRYKIDLSLVPSDATIINKPISFFQKYYQLILWNAVIILVFLLIIFLLVWVNMTKQRANRVMNQAMKKAIESDQLKSAFLANMSHEIRTPMNAIIGFSDLICDDQEPLEYRQKYASIITENAFSLLRLIDDILDISKLEMGQMMLFSERILLNDFVKRIYTSFLANQIKVFSKKNISFKYVVDESLNMVFLHTDPIRIKQVLNNLIDNAFKYTTHGEIELGCKTVDKSHVMFWVKDTGVGIPLDKQTAIFERFRQAETTLTLTGAGGVGLGLSIVKSIVELMKGRIWLVSDGTNGSTFFFTIPIEANAELKRL